MSKAFRYRNLGLKRLTLCRPLYTSASGWEVFEGKGQAHSRGGSLALLDTDAQLITTTGPAL